MCWIQGLAETVDSQSKEALVKETINQSTNQSTIIRSCQFLALYLHLFNRDHSLYANINLSRVTKTAVSFCYKLTPAKTKTTQ